MTKTAQLTVEDIRTRIAGRASDLASLRAMSTSALNAQSKREHRLKMLDAEGDIADLTDELQQVEAADAEREVASYRAKGRAHIASAMKARDETMRLYKEFAATFETQLELARQLRAAHSLLDEEAAKVEYLASIAGEGRAYQRAPTGIDSQYASAFALAIKGVIETLPCGRVIKSTYLSSDPFGPQGTGLIEDVARTDTSLVLDSVGRKCQEPVQAREAA